ncbi:hypothetical protein MBLNU230_g6347t1 [Neophaeotheca triangularis]
MKQHRRKAELLGYKPDGPASCWFPFVTLSFVLGFFKPPFQGHLAMETFHFSRDPAAEIASWSDGVQPASLAERLGILYSQQEQQENGENQLYDPLPLDQNYIRLLKLDRVLEDQGLRVDCSMQTFPLSKLPQYDAISYVWGDSTDRTPINVCGQTLSVTVNLVLALRTLRGHLQNHFWIDGVCINQANIQERNSQVQLMHVIYGEAATVHAFIGHALTPSTRNALDMESLSFPSTAARELLMWPWWNRLWVIQEVKLARKVVAHFDTLCIDFDTLTDKLDSCHDNVRLVTVWKTRNGLGLYRRGTFDKIDRLMRGMGLQEASDPRDYVYGALALLPPAIDIQADYTKSVEHVFEEFAARTMQSRNSLDLLDNLDLGVRSISLPSWSPDWRLSSMLALGPPARWTASWDATPRVEYVSRGRLLVRAFIIDRVITIACESAPAPPLQHLSELAYVERLRVRLANQRQVIERVSTTAATNFWNCQGLSTLIIASVFACETDDCEHVCYPFNAAYKQAVKISAGDVEASYMHSCDVRGDDLDGVPDHLYKEIILV